MTRFLRIEACAQLNLRRQRVLNDSFNLRPIGLRVLGGEGGEGE